MSENLNHLYSKKEEFYNVVTHGFGFVLSIIAFPFLVLKSLQYSDVWQHLSFVIYGLSLLILYAASTFYHAAKNPKRRRLLNIFDHAAIYVLIAGSYTPFLLVGLATKTGWYMFLFIWLFAISGVILKLFFTGRFEKISTILYLLMGWIVVIIIKPMYTNLPAESFWLIALGGAFYTIGALFYTKEKIAYNHAIFHVFVLLGSFSHFLAIYCYL